MQQITPQGWQRGQALIIDQYTPKIKIVRAAVNPFNAKPTDADHVEFNKAVDANDWLRWWFTDEVKAPW